jgi:hypothetical protein
MATSAIAACACAHHQPQKAEKKVLSCHSSSHESESPEVSNDDPNRLRLGERCSCYLDQTQTAIVAKSEQKKYKAQHSEVAENISSVAFDIQLLSTTEVPSVSSSLVLYAKLLPRSGPSRAPPRL